MSGGGNVTFLDVHVFILDSNIFDELEKEPQSFIDELHSAVIAASRRMKLFITHVQIDELNRIQSPERREQVRSLLTMFTEITETTGGIYGVSRYGQSTYSANPHFRRICRPLREQRRAPVSDARINAP